MVLKETLRYSEVILFDASGIWYPPDDTKWVMHDKSIDCMRRKTFQGRTEDFCLSHGSFYVFFYSTLSKIWFRPKDWRKYYRPVAQYGQKRGGKKLKTGEKNGSVYKCLGDLRFIWDCDVGWLFPTPEEHC